MKPAGTTYRLLSILALIQPLLLFPLLKPGAGDETDGTHFLRIEKKLYNFINREREKDGLRPLVRFKPLTRIASNHSKKMALSGKISHHLPGSGNLGKRLRQARLFFTICGENLVQSDIPVASVIHDGLMHSRSHRANILNPAFSHCGIHMCCRGDTYYITQTFARLFDPRNDWQAEFYLQEDLERWFVETFNYRFVFHHRSKNQARLLSKKNLIRNGRVKLSRYEGILKTFRMVYPDLTFIREKLQEEIKGIKLEAISIGVASGRTHDHPSGAYAVSALLFGDYWWRLPKSELNRILLNRLNLLRVKNQLPVLKTSPKLTEQASRSLKTGSLEKSGIQENHHSIICLFSLTNPHLIPPEIRDHILSGTSLSNQIGMAVHIPGQENNTPKKIRVCLILLK